MFADEVGQSDFTISSAGHGKFGVTFAQLTSDGKSILTSSSSHSSSSPLFRGVGGNNSSSSISSDGNERHVKDCYLSSRSLEDGSLNWRNNVCSSSNDNGNDMNGKIRHAVYSNKNDHYVYTLDDAGMLRKWDERSGDFVHQVVIQTNDNNGNKDNSDNHYGAPRLFPLSDTILGCVKALDSITLYNMNDMTIVQDEASGRPSVISAMTILNKANVKKKTIDSDNSNDNSNDVTPQIIQTVGGNIIAAWVQVNKSTMTTTTSFDQMAVYKFSSASKDKEYQKLHHSNSSTAFSSTSLDTSSITVSEDGDSIASMSTSLGGDGDGDGDKILVYTPNEKLEATYDITNKDNSDAGATLKPLTEKMNGIVHDGMGLLQCNDISTIISKKGVLDTGTTPHDVPISIGDDTETRFVQMLHCDRDGMVALVASASGSTLVFRQGSGSGSGSSSGDDGDAFERKFLAEEAMGSVTSATFLTFTHDKDAEKSGDDDEEDVVLQSLSFSSRLDSQFESLKTFVSGGFVDQAKAVLKKSGGDNGKEIIFGLKKVAVMLSDPFSKLLGVDTSAGTISWTMPLNPHAMRHKVVHGTSTSRSSVFGHGIHHPHSPEILVLSQLSDAVEWRCVDGLRGRVISQSQIPLSKSVVQIMPIHAHSHGGGGCKQNALLLLEDDSILVVPSTSQSVSEISKTITSGLYTHKINKETGLFTTMKIEKDSKQAVVIGETVFDPSAEKIVNVVYPQRNEVVQSPATILGDDSLLLKYLNPHLCVIVTEVTENFRQHLKEEEGNTLYDALSSSKSGSGSSKQKTKPVGVTKPGEEPSSVAKTVTPTLFINVVDTVSGQILHRVSHAHVGPGATLADAVNVPVVISENWIVYAFPNARTRRTELGVMTLHEGMIDKLGISAFSTPEQQESFSSLTSAKPIVLTKTYALAVPVSAVGVTNTKNGISSKNILLGTGAGGQIVRIDRRLLDPRRPSGEPKESEKKEGLMQ